VTFLNISAIKAIKRLRKKLNILKFFIHQSKGYFSEVDLAKEKCMVKWMWLSEMDLAVPFPAALNQVDTIRIS